METVEEQLAVEKLKVAALLQLLAAKDALLVAHRLGSNKIANSALNKLEKAQKVCAKLGLKL